MRQNQGILPKYRRLVSFIICIALGLASSLFLATGAMFTLVAQGSIAPIARLEKPLFNLAEQEKQGRQFYENGQFGNAVLVWQQVLKTYQSHNDHLNQARVWSNLSLAYQRLGQWSLAQKAIANSLELATFKPEKNSPEQLQVLAQVLNTQGSLELGRGNGQAALDIWQKAGETYSKAKNETGVIRSYINQSKALKSLGLYRRALSTLLKVQKMLAAQPDSLMKVVALRNLGNSLRLVNQLEQGEQVLRQGLKLAQKLRSPSDISGSFIDLGNLARTQEKSKSAVDYYQQAIDTAPSIAIKIHAQLNQLSTFIHIEDWEKGKALVNQIQSQLINLPNSRSVIYAQLNLANSLITLHQAKVSGTSNLEAIAKLVATSYEQAQKLGDPQASTYALGKLGGLYEKNQQWSMAKKLTQQALAIAQNTNTPEIIYLWQWQLGRILKAEGDIPGAIANYQEAVKNLQSLRSDLAAFDTDLQFNFREKVEPVYRELVSLLLQPNSSNTPNQDKENLKLGTNNKSLSQADLKLIEQARQIIESLQLAELNNFFREACLDTSTTQVDRIDTEAAVIYPIILRERLEIILSLPKRPLTHYSISIPQNQLEETVEKLRQNLVIRTRYTFKPSAQKLYEWLIRPLENELAQNGINTLVFVPDGVLRNIPMAVLHDGKQYLLETYNLALNPSLELLPPQKLPQEEFKVLGAGLTEARQGFSSLEFVEKELKKIKAEVPSQVLLNHEFTHKNVENRLQSTFFPIVHIATHGKFSSKALDTFILTWNDRININELDDLLHISSQKKQRAVELLVLSACETAVGDKRAALGLAGMAVKAGARSTLATLWPVNDQGTAVLMSDFYQQLRNQKQTKAQALRNSQLALLQNPMYKHPIYWAPYILIGNWL